MAAHSSKQWLPVPTLRYSAAQRARIAIWVVLVVACGNVYLLADAVRRWWREEPVAWQPEPYIEHLALLRESLPRDSRIGYVSTVLHDEGSRRRDLFLVRYALAPRCVLAGSDAELVLVYGAAATAVELHPQMALVRDLGNGFQLYRRLRAP